MRERLEPEVSVVMDVMYPMDGITKAAVNSRKVFPHTPLRLYVEALGGVIKPVLDRTCNIGVIGTLPQVPEELHAEPLVEVVMTAVVAPSHPLAKIRGRVPKSAIAKEVQLVLTDRTSLSEGRNFGVMSPHTWRLADLGAKHAFLESGLGWGYMPYHIVAADIKRGTLVEIRVEGVAPRDMRMPMRVVHRKDSPPGPATRAFIAQLRDCRGRRPGPLHAHGRNVPHHVRIVKNWIGET